MMKSFQNLFLKNSKIIHFFYFISNKFNEIFFNLLFLLFYFKYFQLKYNSYLQQFNYKNLEKDKNSCQ